MSEPPQPRRLISNGNQLRRHGNVTRRNSCIGRDHNHRRRDLRLFAALSAITRRRSITSVVDISGSVASTRNVALRLRMTDVCSDIPVNNTGSSSSRISADRR